MPDDGSKRAETCSILIVYYTNTIIINIIVVLTGSKFCFTINSLGKLVTTYQSTRPTRKLNLEYEKYRTVSKLEKICALLDSYAVGSGSLLPTFRDNL